MDEYLNKITLFFINILTSILSTVLVSIGLFCISWYAFTQEFPPRITHVKEKWAHYQQMIDQSQKALEKIQSLQVSASPQLVTLEQRLQRLETEVQELKAQKR